MSSTASLRLPPCLIPAIGILRLPLCANICHRQQMLPVLANVCFFWQTYATVIFFLCWLRSTSASYLLPISRYVCICHLMPAAVTSFCLFWLTSAIVCLCLPLSHYICLCRLMSASTNWRLTLLSSVTAHLGKVILFSLLSSTCFSFFSVLLLKNFFSQLHWAIKCPWR